MDYDHHYHYSYCWGTDAWGLCWEWMGVSEALDQSCVSHQAWIPLLVAKETYGLVSSDWTRAQQDMTKPTKLLVRVLIHCRFWQPFRAFWCFVVASQDGVYFYGDRAYQPLGLKLLGLASETYCRDPMRPRTFNLCRFRGYHDRHDQPWPINMNQFPNVRIIY